MSFLSAAAWLTTAAGLIVYLVYVLLGIWRRVFWEVLLLGGISFSLAIAGAVLEPSGIGIASALIIPTGWALYVLFVAVLLRNPGTLRVSPGDALPTLRLPDHTGTSRSFQTLTGERGLYLITYRGGW